MTVTVLPLADCLAMPHLAHMMLAVVMTILFAGMVLLMVRSESRNETPLLAIPPNSQSLSCMLSPAHIGRCLVPLGSLIVLVPLLQSVGMCDANPLNINLLSSGDHVTFLKVLVRTESLIGEPLQGTAQDYSSG